MATKRNPEDERLDATNMEKVIALLEPAEGKPITKKLACELLNISYNTTRLTKLIDEFKARKERDAKMRASKRGKPRTDDEVMYTIQEYLNGVAVSVIAEELYRTAGFVNSILEDYSVPKRASSYDYFKPELIPEGAMRDRFAVDEIVYSARYDSTAKVDKESVSKDGEFIYRIWLLAEKWKQFSYQPASELASLEHLKKLGIKI